MSKATPKRPEKRSLQRAAAGACLLLGALFTAGCVTTGQSPAAAPPQVLESARMHPPPVLEPPPPPGPRPASAAPNGSLWAKSNPSLFKDIKAHQIGDILTITVSETSKASKTASTSATRDKNFSGEFTFGGAGVQNQAGTVDKIGGAALGPYSGKFSNGFTGSGATSKEDSMTAYMTATVVDVMPNGNLLIRGTRWTKVNNEMQQITLEGVVRPNDVNRNNSVLSQNIADAKIFFVGKGPVTQQQKPGWLGQLLDVVSPF
ncbi:MAG: flagellar basal body L-ring protein FlgH [Acidobacteriota bacterium]